MIGRAAFLEPLMLTVPRSRFPPFMTRQSTLRPSLARSAHSTVHRASYSHRPFGRPAPRGAYHTGWRDGSKRSMGRGCCGLVLLFRFLDDRQEQGLLVLGILAIPPGHDCAGDGQGPLTSWTHPASPYDRPPG